MPGQRVGEAYAVLSLRGKKFVGGLLSAQANLKAFKRMALIGFGAVSAAAIGAAVATAKIGKSSIDAATVFDRRAREINTLARLSGQEFDLMKAKIISLSSRLGTDATGMAEALYQINSACYKGTEGMKVLEASTKLAVAGLADQESVANAVTTALRAWGISAHNVTRVTDVMFKTVELGKIKVEGIAHGLGYTASIAAQAGLSIEQTSAAVAVLTKGGIQGTKAFRGVSQILNAIIKPSEEASVAFKKIGISAKSIKEIGLIGILQKIREATEGDIEALATLIPNVRALRGALVLTGSMMEEYEDNLVAIKNSTGATNLAFNEMNKSFARFKEVWGTRFRNVMIQLGENIIPTLQKSLQELFNPENLKLFITGMIGVGKVITQSLAHIPTMIGMVRTSLEDLQTTVLYARKGYILFKSATQATSKHNEGLANELFWINQLLTEQKGEKEDLINKYAEMRNTILKILPDWGEFEKMVWKTTFNFGKLNEEADKTNKIYENWSQGKPVGPFPEVKALTEAEKMRKEAADALYETLTSIPADYVFPSDEVKDSTKELRAFEVAANAAGTAIGMMFQKGVDMGQRMRQIIKSAAATIAQILIPGAGGQFAGGLIQALPFQSGGFVPKRMPLVNVATFNENPNRPETAFELPGGGKSVFPWDKLPQMVKAEVYVTNANPDTQVRTIMKANPEVMNELWHIGIRPAMLRDNQR
jgi:TP901 family phage tail tape measure protein